MEIISIKLYFKLAGLLIPWLYVSMEKLP